MTRAAYQFSQLPAVSTTTSNVQHFVIIDPGVDDYQYLADQVIANAEVHIFNPQDDGVW